MTACPVVPTLSPPTQQNQPLPARSSRQLRNLG
jgi:hypothetical protein